MCRRLLGPLCGGEREGGRFFLINSESETALTKELPERAQPPELSHALPSHAMDALIASRHSVRAYLNQAVPKAMVQEILQVAARAPSGSNIQPWRVYVLSGAALARVSREVCLAHDQSAAHLVEPGKPSPFTAPYAYYPRQWTEPYLQRRRDNGWGLYKKLGIEKGEKDKMHRQHQANFLFFGAPVGLMFTLSKTLERGSMLDLGMFMQNTMLAAKARGLDTCPQAAWLPYASVVMPLLGADPEQETLMCGMSLGYADTKARVNDFHTPRESVEGFAHWVSEPAACGVQSMEGQLHPTLDRHLSTSPP